MRQCADKYPRRKAFTNNAADNHLAENVDTQLHQKADEPLGGRCLPVPALSEMIYCVPIKHVQFNE